MATKKVFTASSTALSINSITKMHGKDLEALLEVITDYFDQDEREVEYDFDDDEAEISAVAGDSVPHTREEPDSAVPCLTTTQEAAGHHTGSHDTCVHCDLSDMVAPEPMEHTEGQHAHTHTHTNSRHITFDFADNVL